MDFLDKQQLYKIVCSRDKRFDGRFYCGVKTTGIYCRPICPARPKLANIEFYRSAAEAENSGYRACLRCRPDLAPSSAQWGGTAATVGRALTLIARGDADDSSIADLAKRLGVSDRHLRRLFDEHVGASPVYVATSKRLHLAKQLLTQSNMTVTDIAFASGYRSIRRFNEAFKDKFQSAPSDARRAVRLGQSMPSNVIHIEIPVIAPFDWPHILGFLRNHAVTGVEAVTADVYRREIDLSGASGGIQVTFDANKCHLVAAVTLSDPSRLREVIERVRDLFDTRLNPHAHVGDLDSNDAVAADYLEVLGIRIPGAWDGFETAVCIILGQLVSVEQAARKIGKLVEQLGTKVPDPMFPECSFRFPSAEAIAGASLAEIGMTRVRESAIRELARQYANGHIDLSRSANIEKTKAQLLAIKGIGPWTVEMIGMRCLGDSNAFPKTDLIVKRALEHHKLPKGDWSPWNSYVALAMWKKYATSLSFKTKKKSAAK